MPSWSNQPWRRDSNETASGKPGAVQVDIYAPIVQDQRAMVNSHSSARSGGREAFDTRIVGINLRVKVRSA
jgi:hypothetical protein